MLVVFFLTNCELKFNSANAKYVYNSYACYSYREEIKQGMRYGIWYVDDNSSQTGYAVAVVNLTKDALEIELIKKQINAIDNPLTKKR